MATHNKEKFKALFEDEETCVTVLYIAARLVFGEDFDEWETETIRIEMADTGWKIPEENVESLLVAVAVRISPGFQESANIFENAVMVFNNYESMPEVWQKATPAFIAWGIEEASVLHPAEARINEFLGEDPVNYIAHACIDFGLSVTPPSLDFCGPRIAELTKSDVTFQDEVKKQWAAIDKKNLSAYPFTEDPVGVQLALMASVEVYLQDKIKLRQKQLEVFQTS